MQHLLKLGNHRIGLLRLLVYLLHKALHLAECLDDRTDFIRTVRKLARNLTRKVSGRDGTQMSDGGSERIGDVICNAARHKHTKAHRNDDDDGKAVDRTVIARIVCLKELLPLEHVVGREHRHIA